METLQNEVFRVEFSPEKGMFSIFTLDPSLPDLLNCRLKLEYRQEEKKHVHLVGDWQGQSAGIERITLPAHGDVDLLRFDAGADKNGIGIHLDFGILQEYPLVIWRAVITNHGSLPARIDRMVMLDLEPQWGAVIFSQARDRTQMGFFSNGWQSWSTSQWYPAEGQMHNSRLGMLQLPMIKYAGTPLKSRPGEFSSDFFAVLGDRKARTGFLVGFLSQKEQFGSITCTFANEISLRMWANGDGARLDPGHAMTTDWAVFNPILLDHRDPLDKYTEAVARENEVKLPAEAPLGWCSWYDYYTRVTADDIRQNLASLVEINEKLPVQLVQIDDGFETQVGDWFTFKDTFPAGVKPLAEEIRREGLIPGLWLAPFAVHPRSMVFKEHPDWILRSEKGRPVNAGFGWGALFTSLDLTVPAALEYAVSTVRTAALEWGYPYLKLDFLYTAALPGKYADETLTRAQVMRLGMQAVRDAVGPETFLLGCGAPLGSVLGLADANRIGPDVSGSWTPEFAGVTRFFLNERGMPSARNSIRNILTRANLHGHWWANDPDCLLLREDTRLSLAEVRTLASVIALTGGSLLLSDDLPKVSPERLRIAEALIPMMDERARVIDWFDREVPEKLRLDLLNDTGEWHVLGVFNWVDQPKDLIITPADFALAEDEYWLREFWSGELRKLSQQNPAVFNGVAPHGGLVLAARRATPDQALYLGSDLHISQGMEVSSWQETGQGIEIKLRLPRTANGHIEVRTPRKVNRVLLNGFPVEFVQGNDDVLWIPVTVEGFADVEVIYTA